MRKSVIALSVFFSAATMAWAADAPLNPQPMPPGAHTQSATTTTQVQSPRDPCAKSQTSVVEYKDGEDGVNRSPPDNHKPGKMTQKEKPHPQNCWPVKH